MRSGTYVCVEWDLGGYPAWLLKDHSMKLRSLQPMFQVAATRWILRLGQKLAPLQASRGRPILAVQVEKEYGSFGDDHDYMKRVLEVVIRAGLGGALLYTGDGADVLQNGSLSDLPAALDFGTGDAERSTKLFQDSSLPLRDTLMGPIKAAAPYRWTMLTRLMDTSCTEPRLMARVWDSSD